MKKIYFANPKENYLKSKKLIDIEINKCLNSNTYILGNNVKKFEKTFANYIKTNYCISVKNGTDAITMALQSLSLKKNSKIIVPSMTATATAMAVMNADLKPVFCDVNDQFYTSDLEDIKSKFNKDIRGVIVVHLHGQSVEIDKIQKFCNEKKIFLIEDCAQSSGSYFKKKPLGSFGVISTHSFFPTKNLSAMGDGGAICTSNKKIFTKLLKIRQYGWNSKRISLIRGLNSRMDELQASILNVKLRFLNKDITERRKIAKIYDNKINQKKYKLPIQRKNSKHSYHIYSIQHKSRDKLKSFLQKKGYYCGIHYQTPVHKMPFFKKKKNKLNVTEKLCKKFLSLPIYPEMKQKDVLKVIKLLNSF